MLVVVRRASVILHTAAFHHPINQSVRYHRLVLVSIDAVIVCWLFCYHKVVEVFCVTSIAYLTSSKSCRVLEFASKLKHTRHVSMRMRHYYKTRAILLGNLVGLDAYVANIDVTTFAVIINN